MARTSLTTQSAAQDGLRPRPTTAAASRKDSRSLATAASPHTPGSESIPFLTNVPLPTPNQSRAVPSFSSIRPWDHFKPLVIHEQIAEPPPHIVKKRGIGGDPTELIQNLHACLGVARWDRAEAIVRRLADIYNPSAPELLEAHIIYVRALIDALSNGRRDVSLKRIQQWFEVEVRGNGVQPNPTMLALMCRASFNGLQGKTRDRTVRRYLNLAEQANILDATMVSGEFPHHEWQELVATRNDLFEPIPPSEVAQDVANAESLQLSQALGGHVSTAPSLEEIRPVEQKGFGLTTLQKSLETLIRGDLVPYPHHLDGTKEEKDRAWNYARQEKLEENVVDAAIERWRAEHTQMLKMGINTTLRTKPMEALLWQWHTALEAEVKKELEQVRQVLDNEVQHVGDDRLSYGPYLESVKAEKLAANTILTTLEVLAQQGLENGARFSIVSERLGMRLEVESNATVENKYVRDSKQRKRVARHRDQILRNLYKGRSDFHPIDESSKTNAEASVVQVKQFEWPRPISVQIGALLVAKLIDVAKINSLDDEGAKSDDAGQLEPAFTHGLKSWRGRPIGLINAHKALIQKLMKEPPRSLIGSRLPMLVEPEPWTGIRNGAYLRYPIPVMRTKGKDEVQDLYARAASDKGDLRQVYAGLDVLGRTAWRINQDVLKVIIDAWSTGEAIANIPPEVPDLPYPPEPDASKGEAARWKWKSNIKALENEKSGYHSSRCFFNLQLEIARAFSKETFYYPHNIDFRGRAYPIPPYLNHMGADHTRGLLIFAKGKELGLVGLRWLKIHLANVYGYDKANLQEREDFATEHLADIYDSATNPLTGARWWLKADDPWQCLATCFELKNAFDSSDPTKFVSHLPVHQDGTCNGLQHYAALGGDTFGAMQVNLEPGDRPADVYSGVANLVKAEVDCEAEEGNETAKFLQNKISRKVVKQTVMTNVYGVTYVGARAQVQRQLDAIMRSGSEFHVPNYQLAAYIAKKIFKALATMFQGAQAIQFWLGECADRISTAITPEQIVKILERRGKKLADHDPKYKSKVIKWSRNVREMKTTRPNAFRSQFKSSVIWTTPLKLPVVQPYRNDRRHDVKTALQAIAIKAPRVNDPVSKRKQLQAFPPNFIHSLDATHMLLSALKCDEIGLTFAAVHDSFWTHAGDVPVMNRVIRDAFVRMHSEDIIGRLAAEFAARYSGSMYLASIYARSPTGKKIKSLRNSRAQTKAQRRRRAGEKAVTKEEGLNTYRNQMKNRGNYLSEELLQEFERQQMLKSEDSEQRRKAEEMITPASIFLAADSADLALPPEISNSALGAIPDKEPVASFSNQAREDMEPFTEENDSMMTTEAGGHEEWKCGETDEGSNADEEGASDKTAAAPKKRLKESKIFVWVPLTFPEVPQKGDWDITRLKDSVYFFS